MQHSLSAGFGHRLPPPHHRRPHAEEEELANLWIFRRGFRPENFAVGQVPRLELLNIATQIIGGKPSTSRLSPVSRYTGSTPVGLEGRWLVAPHFSRPCGRHWPISSLPTFLRDRNGSWFGQLSNKSCIVSKVTSCGPSGARHTLIAWGPLENCREGLSQTGQRACSKRLLDIRPAGRLLDASCRRPPGQSKWEDSTD